LFELSLHILDLIENSVRANASTIAVTVEEKPEEDRWEITVEDNGAGLRVSPEQALDPFYTTKNGKRTGLGLSLFQTSVEQAGGRVILDRSPLGGLAVKATMCLSHADRAPLGDLAATLASVVCTNPQLDLRCRYRAGGRECIVRAADVANELPADQRCGLAIARRVSERIKEGLESIKVMA